MQKICSTGKDMASYLDKHTLFKAQIPEKPRQDLSITVAIPCYDEKNLVKSLQSLNNCIISDNFSVEVIVVINSGEKDEEKVKSQNINTLEEAKEWSKNTFLNPKIRFHFLHHPDLIHKQAGVGLARKIGMDEAVYRFHQINNTKGIIACFDADTLCQKNYLIALFNHFKNYPKTSACSIYFEHPLSGDDFPQNIYQAIILYELHLRYYIQIQRHCGFPFAIHTIGSAMAVRCDAYQKQGGMNKRKAGEDFYFLQKFIKAGICNELNTTTVIPSPRPSHRVPFGTGKAVQELFDRDKLFLETYHPAIFDTLKQLFYHVKTFYNAENAAEINTFVNKMPENVQTFLKEQNFMEKIKEIQNNTSNEKTFIQRFYHWFDAFKLMKFVHFSRDRYYPNIDVCEAAKILAQNRFGTNLNMDNPKKILLFYREKEKKDVPLNLFNFIP